MKEGKIMSELEDKVRKAVEKSEAFIKEQDSFMEDFQEKINNPDPDSIFGLMKSIKEKADNINRLTKREREGN